MDLLLDARKHYPTILEEDLKVLVLEALPMILPGFNEKLAEFAKERCRKREIDIRLKTAANNLAALIENSQKEKFEYHSKGQMAIIGKRTGIATFLGMNISGFWAWLIWRNVYLSKMAILEKKTRVFLDWTIDLFFDRDISRLKLMKKEEEKEYKVLDEVDDVW